MAITSKITKRGQTTLPVEVRKRLHASAGDTLEYELTAEGILLKIQQPDLDEALANYLGVFGKSSHKTVEESL